MGLTAVQMQYTKLAYSKLAYINWYSSVISTENNHKIDWWHHFVVFICKNNGFWFQAQQFCVKCSWCGHYYELNTVALNEIGFFEHIIHRSTHTHTHTYTDIFLACVHGDISNIFAKMILIPNRWNKSKNSHRILSINVNENILPNVIKRWPEMLGLLFFHSNGAELIILCSQHIFTYKYHCANLFICGLLKGFSSVFYFGGWLCVLLTIFPIMANVIIFCIFFFAILISNIQSKNVGGERSVIQNTDTKMEIKRIPCPMLFASHSSQNHFINIYSQFVVLVCLCADWLYTYIFGSYCRCCHHHLIPSLSLLSSSLFGPLFVQRIDRHHTHKVNTSSRYKRHPKIENTQTLFDNIVYDIREKMWKESMRCSRRPNKSLRDQLNSSLNDVDVFDDDNRYLYVCCVLLSSFLCRPVCYCFLFLDNFTSCIIRSLCVLFHQK